MFSLSIGRVFTKFDIPNSLGCPGFFRAFLQNFQAKFYINRLITINRKKLIQYLKGFFFEKGYKIPWIFQVFPELCEFPEMVMIPGFSMTVNYLIEAQCRLSSLLKVKDPSLMLTLLSFQIVLFIQQVVNTIVVIRKY